MTTLLLFITLQCHPGFFDLPPEQGLLLVLDYYDVQYPEIVYAQAVIETGHFRSELCVKHNNLFGLKHGGHYMRFDHWTESVMAYKLMVQSKYRGGDYYEFLDSIGYAESPDYTDLVKLIIRQLNPEDYDM